MKSIQKHVAAGLASIVTLSLAPPVRADDDVKRQCVAASTTGQTLRKDEKLLESLLSRVRAVAAQELVV